MSEKEINHLGNIQALINDGFLIDSSSVQARHAIGRMPNSAIRSTMAMIIGYLHAMQKVSISEIEVLPAAHVPMYDHRNDPANKKDNEQG